MLNLQWQSAVDFVVLAIAIYLLLEWGRRARALRLALIILSLHVGALVARQFDLLITGWVLDAATIVALLALLVVFQPELRRALMRLDITGRVSHRESGSAIAAISAAAMSLAQVRCGALIVLVRSDSLAELLSSGVPIGGRISAEILQAIFQKGSPVHDGAVVVADDVVTQAGAILPLTQRANVDERYGTRHRAALGLSERSDAVTIVVSEERGEVTVMVEGHALATPTADALQALLGKLTRERPVRRVSRVRRALRPDNLRWAAGAAALAALVWSVTFLLPGRAVRVQAVPVELTNLPTGLTVASQSSDTVQVWVRGSEFLFDSVSLGGLVARCDLSAAHPGLNHVRVQVRSVAVPLGLAIERVAPRDIGVELTR